jgi:crotonobetainyl-CoA:carnitine CoA-transferase CaiB-like acyl-CoA transferase
MFQTADGYINVAASGDSLWKKFCEAAGAKDLLDSPDYATPAARVKNRKQLNARLAEVIRKHPNDFWVDLMYKVGVPCGPINTIDKVFADPQVQHLGIAKPVDHPKYGAQKVVGQPIHLSRYEQPEKLQHTPEPGEHNEQILQSLGYDKAGIEQLRAKGAI